MILQGRPTGFWDAVLPEGRRLLVAVALAQFRWWQSPLAPSAEMAPSEILLILLESERKQQSWVVLFQCLGDLPEALAQACVKLAHLELHGLALSLSTEQLLVK